jgi:Domain of unknown function (DUF4190)
VALCPYSGVSQPVPQQEWAAPQSSNKAIASLVCGVLFLCAPASIAAIILGHLALADIKRGANRLTGHGPAVAGLVMGYLGIALTTMYIVFVVFIVRTTLSRDIPANETSAIATMRTYDRALKAYAAKCPQQGYPATLLPLGPGAGQLHAREFDRCAARGSRTGAKRLPVSIYPRRKRFGTSTGFCIGGSTGTAKFNRGAIFLPG